MTINHDEVRRIREIYPRGTKVRLIRMADIQAPPIGSLGTVKGVDDAGSVMVAWDTGSSLSVILGVDEIEIVRSVK